MFTGIIEEIGLIENVSRSKTKNTLTISCNKILDDIHHGDSIAVNGVCFTVSSFGQHSFRADIMPVTFQKTTFQTIAIGKKVNLERALKLNSRLGGHLVSGHIDAVGKIFEIKSHQNAILCKVSLNSKTMKYLIPEGSICLDGVSLTISKLSRDFLVVSIIPDTYSNTIMQFRREGDWINIETDFIGKYLYNYLHNNKKEEIGLNFLKENGFV